MPDKPRYVWLVNRFADRFRAQICRDAKGRIVLATDGAARYSIIDAATGDCADPRGYGATLSENGRRTVRKMMLKARVHRNIGAAVAGGGE